jgi:hypothetical protein
MCLLGVASRGAMSKSTPVRTHSWDVEDVGSSDESDATGSDNENDRCVVRPSGAAMLLAFAGVCSMLVAGGTALANQQFSGPLNGAPSTGPATAESSMAGPKVALGLLQGTPHKHVEQEPGGEASRPVLQGAAVGQDGPEKQGHVATPSSHTGMTPTEGEGGAGAALMLLLPQQQGGPEEGKVASGSSLAGPQADSDGSASMDGNASTKPGAQPGRTATSSAGYDSGWWQRYALPCWDQCAGAGLCEGYCGSGRSCCKYGDAADPPTCRGVKWWSVMTFHTCVTGSPEEAMLAAAAGMSMQGAFRSAVAPVHRFYVYRAQSDESQYEFSNVNAGNLAGVMWYLTNEVMPRCPKRYGITRLKRLIVTTRASPELFARGMNFGVRYSYDHGRCTGSNTRDLGHCNLTWHRFGHVVGCNNFRDHYPYPLSDTHYPDGIWYDFPGEGKCNYPTGEWNCTWSVEEAGEIRLEEELEASFPGLDYCCHGRCTRFWQHPSITSKCSQRVQEALRVFKNKFPGMPLDLPAPRCDFDRSQFWADWQVALNK